MEDETGLVYRNPQRTQNQRDRERLRIESRGTRISNVRTPESYVPFDRHKKKMF